MKPRIRLAVPTDSDAIAEIYAPAITDNATSFEATPPDGAEIARRIESLRATHPWLVCEEDGKVLGYTYASRHRDRAGYLWSVEVSAYVHPAAHRRGIGKALYTSLFSILALQGFRNAYAGITIPNPASEALHKSMGFTTVGVFHSIGYRHGAWRDVMWLERQLAALEMDPQAPRSLADIAKNPAFALALAVGLPHLQRRNS